MLVAYIYDQTDTVVTQFFKITNFQCRTIMNDIGTASFNVDTRESGVGYSYLKEFTRCRIVFTIPRVYEQQEVRDYSLVWDDLISWDDSLSWEDYIASIANVLVSGTDEKTVFDGVIRETIATQTGIQVTLNDFLYLLKKKKLYTNKTYTTVAVNTILSEILGEINTRYDSKITLSTTETATLSKTYKDMISFFDILQDIAGSGYEFSITNKVLTFSQKIGIDRTVDPNFVEFRYDVAVPQEINIANYSIRRDAENFCNAPTATDGTTTSTTTDAPSIASFGRIEEVYTVNGDVANSATKSLADRKGGISEVSVTPITDNFFIADIGDTVKVYIDGGNDMQFYDGSMRVVEKGIQYSGSNQTVSIVLSVNKIATPTLLDTIKNLRERVKKMEV